MAQPVYCNSLSPAVEDEPCNGHNAPPREMAEDDLQIYQQLTDLYIEVGAVEAQHEIEIVRKEAYDDARKV